MNIFDSTYQFEDRFVAFLDILGFKDYILNLEKTKDENQLKKIKSILNFMQEETEESHYQTDLPVYELKDGQMYEKELGDPKMLYVSDCMIISADGNLDGFKILSNKLHKIITDLAVDGIFCRGAISKGNLFHQDKFIFGSAYIKAYQLEPKAIYPRIIVDPDILHFFDLSEEKVPLAPAFYAKDTDGFYYLKYFTLHFFPPYMGDWIHFLLVVRLHIIERLNNHSNRAHSMQGKEKEGENKLFQKYEWLAMEFNRNIDFYSRPLTKILDSERDRLKNYEEEAVKEFGEHISRVQFKPRDLNKIKKESEIKWV